MFSLHGTGIGGGIVIGRARVLESRQRDVVRYRLQPGQADGELVRLEVAIEAVKTELHALADHLPEDAPSEARALLDVHAMILDDPVLSGAARAPPKASVERRMGILGAGGPSGRAVCRARG